MFLDAVELSLQKCPTNVCTREERACRKFARKAVVGLKSSLLLPSGVCIVASDVDRFMLQTGPLRAGRGGVAHGLGAEGRAVPVARDSPRLHAQAPANEISRGSRAFFLVVFFLHS